MQKDEKKNAISKIHVKLYIKKLMTQKKHKVNIDSFKIVNKMLTN